MTLPKPVFVGFLAKATELRPDWLEVSSVEEICSVSECISKAPSNRLKHWTHNMWGFYDNEDAALSVIEDASRHYDLYAYELYPFSCHAQEKTTIEDMPDIGQVPSSYEFLGYDIVSKSLSDFFECSPLSCNHGACDFLTNEHCLIDEESYADQVLLQICGLGSKYEPGPYHLFRVYRKQGA